jgi:serine/threonine-protein phosphatase 2A regulatory subunit B'
MPSDPIPHSPHGRGFASPDRTLGPDGAPTPPRAGPLQRLRGGPKDTIPIVGKAPRKQRSSRFYVSDKVEIEKLPAFTGTSVLVLVVLELMSDIRPEERNELFVRKLQQCKVVFDFNDASAELQGKQVKAQTLHEMLEYITQNRGVVTEQIYPEVVNMVRPLLDRGKVY